MERTEYLSHVLGFTRKGKWVAWVLRSRGNSFSREGTLKKSALKTVVFTGKSLSLTKRFTKRMDPEVKGEFYMTALLLVHDI